MDNLLKAKEISKALFERGHLVDVYSLKRRLSTESVVRIIINTAHSTENVTSLIGSFDQIQKRLI